jgi:hypothetical protein
MAIIYTYPTKATPNDNDLILISDSEDSNKTKQVKISTLPGGSGSGVSSVTAVLPLASTGGGTPAISLTGLTGFGTTGQVIKVNSNADGLEWGAAGGSGPDGSDHDIQYKNGSAFAGTNDLRYHPTQNELSVKHTVIVKGQGSGNPSGRLKLNCEQDSHAITLEGPAHSGGTDYTLKFPSAAPADNQVLQYTTAGNLGWIPTPSGSGGVGTFTNAFGTYITGTSNSTATGAVDMGNVDLSAANGSSATAATRFLSKDNEWAVPTYTTNTNIANTQLQLNDNRTLDFYDGSTSVRSLSFIRTNGGSVNMFKFWADGGTAPTFTVGNTESSYEGYVVIEGNGSNRTGQVQFQNAAGDYHTGIKATTTQAATITYTLPATQAAAGEFLKNDGTGVLSWDQGASYTEGTWTPSLTFGGGEATPTLAVASGNYVIIGKYVYANFYVVVQAGTQYTGTSARISIPVTAASHSGGHLMMNNAYTTASTNTSIILGSVVGGMSIVGLKTMDVSGSEVRIQNLATSPSTSYNNAVLAGSIIYLKS